MKRVIAYAILRGNIFQDRPGTGSLETQVKEFLDRGWQPVGPAMPIDRNSTYAMQTMVQYAADPIHLPAPEND